VRNTGYRITILLTFAWAVLLPFLWMFRISIEFNLSANTAFLAYRPELVAVAPSAVLLVGAWRLRSWAVPGLFIGAFGMALLKATLGGAPTDAWKLGGFLFICLALRLTFLLKQERQSSLES
jgi:hypothetical protein